MLSKTLKQRHDFTRSLDRIRSSDIITKIFKNSLYAQTEDPSLIVVKGSIDGIDCVVLGQEKIRKGKPGSAIGMMTDKGYSFVLKMLEEAEKNKNPVITFIDCFGGSPSMESELGGQGFLISDCISFFCRIKVPTVSYIIGEGGSGGALALQVTDKSYMLRNASYSVITPESCANILFPKKISSGESLDDVVEDALQILQPSAEHILEIGMIDGILPEPDDINPNNYDIITKTIEKSLIETLGRWFYTNRKNGKKEITDHAIKSLVKIRRQKVLNYGRYNDSFRGLLKTVFKGTKKNYFEGIKVVNIEEESEFYEVHRKILEEKGISDKEFIVCEEEWDKGVNGKIKFKVTGGCGPLNLSSFRENFYACPECGKGEILDVQDQIRKILDENTFKETEHNLTIEHLINKERYNILGYSERLKRFEEKCFSKESLVTGIGRINKKNVVVAISDMEFIGGTFGAVYGEKFRRAVNLAIREEIPLISICSSGGARMYEGPMSLAQMAKMNMALLDLKNEGIPFISVISEPTTGGAYASYVTQGDIIIGEKGSLVEFAGPRVVMGAGIKVDKDVVCTDTLYKNRRIHHLVNRNELKNTLSYYVEFFHNSRHHKGRKDFGRIKINE